MWQPLKFQEIIHFVPFQEAECIIWYCYKSEYPERKFQVCLVHILLVLLHIIPCVMVHVNVLTELCWTYSVLGSHIKSQIGMSQVGPLFHAYNCTKHENIHDYSLYLLMTPGWHLMLLVQKVTR